LRKPKAEEMHIQEMYSQQKPVSIVITNHQHYSLEIEGNNYTEMSPLNNVDAYGDAIKMSDSFIPEEPSILCEIQELIKTITTLLTTKKAAGLVTKAMI